MHDTDLIREESSGNQETNKVLHDLDLYHTCVVVFPNLRKEWVPFVHLIDGIIGTFWKLTISPLKSKISIWVLHMQNF